MSDGTTSFVPIPSVKVPDGATLQPRLELRTMAKKYPDMFNLYLLGMEEFQKTPEKMPLSYYQIAGIHGRPYRRWPDKSWNKASEQQVGAFGGYCTHSSILFLPWHRPYLALFEMALRQNMKKVAKLFTDAEGKANYLDAADKFRLPYWDWALPSQIGRAALPAEVLDSAKPKLVRPKASTNTGTSNPLGGYDFKTDPPRTVINKFTSNRTSRHPRDYSGASGDPTADLDSFATEKQDQGGRIDFAKGKNLTERTVYLLQSYDRFAPMSEDTFYPQSDPTIQFDNWGSLEDTHNTIHGVIGGGFQRKDPQTGKLLFDRDGRRVMEGGHMGNPAIAAFDPVFWLHHTNIDRLWAIWQALHEDVKNAKTFVEPRRTEDGNFTTPARSVENKDTPLAPFQDPDGNMYTSATARKTSTFGYAYPETLGKTYEQTLAALQELYQTASLSNIVLNARKGMTTASDALALRAQSHVLAKQASLGTQTFIAVPQAGVLPQALAQQVAQIPLQKERSVKDLIVHGKYLEWLVNLKASKHMLGGDFLVHIFLGPPGEDPALYAAQPTHVASFTTFGQGLETECENCQEGIQHNLQVTGQIPLTIALTERYIAGQLRSLQPEDVVGFLQENLHWRVGGLDGARLHREDTTGLLVAVVSNEVTVPNSVSVLPVYSPHNVAYPEITTHNGDPRGRGTGFIGGLVPT